MFKQLITWFSSWFRRRETEFLSAHKFCSRQSRIGYSSSLEALTVQVEERNLDQVIEELVEKGDKLSSRWVAGQSKWSSVDVVFGLEAERIRSDPGFKSNRVSQGVSRSRRRSSS
jgi:hypothetical protein